MLKIRFHSQVAEDLQNIQNWYEIRMGVETAEKVSNSILEYISRLQEFPNMGIKTPDKWLTSIGYKMFIMVKHVAIYRIEEDEIVIYFIADLKSNYMKNFYLSGRILHEDEAEYVAKD